MKNLPTTQKINPTVSIEISLFTPNLVKKNQKKNRLVCCKMDTSEIARKLGLSESKLVLRKAAELRRQADIQFNSSIIGVVRFS